MVKKITGARSDKNGVTIVSHTGAGKHYLRTNQDGKSLWNLFLTMINPKSCVALLLVLLSFTAQADSVSLAQRALQDGDYKSALSLLDQHLQQNPDDADGMFSKGLALTMLDRTSEAISEFQKLLASYPDLPEPANNLAVLYAREKRFLDARDVLEKLIEKHSNYSTAHENLGDVYSSLARSAYNEAAALDGKNSSIKLKLEAIATITALQRKQATRAPSAPRQDIPSATAAPKIQVAMKPRAIKRPAIGAEQQLLSNVHAWLAAWQGKETEKYLNFYSPNFVPGHGKSRSSWERERRERLEKPGQIQITLSNANVDVRSGNRARVDFDQHYKAENYSDRVRKRLHFSKVDGHWTIARESVLSVMSN